MAIFIIQEAGQQDRRYQIRIEKSSRARRQMPVDTTHTTVSAHFKVERIDKDTTNVTASVTKPVKAYARGTCQIKPDGQVGKFTSSILETT